MDKENTTSISLQETNGIASFTQEKATESSAIEIPQISFPKGAEQINVVLQYYY